MQGASQARWRVRSFAARWIIKNQPTLNQKNNQKSTKNGPRKPPKMGSWSLLGPLGGLLVLGGILEAVLGRLGGVLVANMAPSWPPKRSPNGSNIEAKINHFLNASWDQIFEGCWWILEAKMGPSWHPNRIKNRYQLRKAIF